MTLQETIDFLILLRDEGDLDIIPPSPFGANSEVVFATAEYHGDQHILQAYKDLSGRLCFDIGVE